MLGQTVGCNRTDRCCIRLAIEHVEQIRAELEGRQRGHLEFLRVVQIELPVTGATTAARGLRVRRGRVVRVVDAQTIVGARPLLPRLTRLEHEVRAEIGLPIGRVVTEYLEQVRSISRERAVLVIPSELTGIVGVKR